MKVVTSSDKTAMTAAFTVISYAAARLAVASGIASSSWFPGFITT